jgi:hypothetical protein
MITLSVFAGFALYIGIVWVAARYWYFSGSNGE